jgi:hypothetical protein
MLELNLAPIWALFKRDDLRRTRLLVSAYT